MFRKMFKELRLLHKIRVYKKQTKEMMRLPDRKRKPWLLELSQCDNKIFHCIDFKDLNDGNIPYHYTNPEKPYVLDSGTYSVSTKFSREKLGNFFVRRFGRELFLVEIASNKIFYSNTDLLRLEPITEGRMVLNETERTRATLIFSIAERCTPKEMEREIREGNKKFEKLSSRWLSNRTFEDAIENWRYFL